MEPKSSQNEKDRLHSTARQSSTTLFLPFRQGFGLPEQTASFPSTDRFHLLVARQHAQTTILQELLDHGHHGRVGEHLDRIRDLRVFSCGNVLLRCGKRGSRSSRANTGFAFSAAFGVVTVLRGPNKILPFFGRRLGVNSAFPACSSFPVALVAPDSSRASFARWCCCAHEPACSSSLAGGFGRRRASVSFST